MMLFVSAPAKQIPSLTPRDSPFPMTEKMGLNGRQLAGRGLLGVLGNRTLPLGDPLEPGTSAPVVSRIDRGSRR